MAVRLISGGGAAAARRLVSWVVLGWLLLAGAGCGPKYELKDLDLSNHWRHIPMPKPAKPLGHTLSILAWRDYLDPDILKHFETTYGVNISVRLINSNEELYEVLTQPGGPVYDLVMPSTYMAQRLIKEGRLRPYDRENVPNHRLIDAEYFQLKFDPDLKYALPFYHVTAGVAFNVQYASGLPVTWAEFAKQKSNGLARGRLAALDRQRVLFGFALMMNGFSPNSTSPAEIARARDTLLDIKRSMDIRFTTQNISKVLEYEDAILGACWSGDAGWAQTLNGYVRFVVPNGKALCDVISMCITSRARHPETAEFFLNYLLTPQVFGAMSNHSYYANTSVASHAFVDAALRNGPSYMLPMPGKILFLEDVGEEASRLYSEAWHAVKTAPSPQITKLPLPFPRTHSSSVKAHEEYYEER